MARPANLPAQACVYSCDRSRKGLKVETGEEVLIRLAKAGDAEAFCRLAREYERRVYSLALHFCRDPHDAEDLSQEVWLKAFRSLEGFRGEASFYTWLRQIVVNTFLNHRRAMTYTLGSEKRSVKFEALEAVDAEGSHNGHGGAHAADLIEQSLLVGRVMEALGGLTPPQRLAFLLKHREGMTYQEIADAFGCSAGAVKKNLYRAVMKLRDALGVGSEQAECVTSAAGERG